MAQLHATAVAIDGEAVLLTGPSGCGKSDLALRLLDRAARLVADDRCDVRADKGVLRVSPPRRLEGMLEVRGVGILLFPFDTSVPLRMICELRPYDEVVRLPATETNEIERIRLPVFRIDPFTASAPAKLTSAMALTRGQIGRVA